MKINKKILALVLGASLSSVALADADFAVGSPTAKLETTTHVKLTVKIPAILIFKVGDKGDTINEITWDYTGASNGNNQTYTGAIPVVATPLGTPKISDDDSTSASQDDGILNTYVYGNSSDVTITVDATTPPTLNGANGATIPMTDFTVVDTGNVPHPAGPIVAGNMSFLPFIAGAAISEEDTWAYTYAASTTPAAGDYTATVTYKATVL